MDRDEEGGGLGGDTTTNANENAGTASSMSVSVSVAELVTNEAEKSFQIKLSSEWHQEGVETTKFTVLRTHAQGDALVARLNESHKNVLVPIFPDAPASNSLADADALEKKRRQYDRFFVFLASRDVFATDPDFKTFLTATISEPVEKKATKASQVFNSLVTRAEHGFKLFNPSFSVVDEQEETEFEKRRMYLLQTERVLKAVLETVADVIRARSALGRTFIHLGEAFGTLETGTEKPFGGRMKNYNELGIQLHSVHFEQVKEEVFHFGDVILEHKNHCQSFKNLLNNRTNLLMELDAAHRHEQKCKEQVEKLKRKHSDVSQEVLSAQDEEEKAKKNVVAMEEAFEKLKKNITAEYERFEKERVVDFKMALDHYVRTQINFEESKLRLLTQLSEQQSK